eukprot:scaffold67473_cov57-Phaeocystis_antarctica.AAC.3
MVAAGRAVVVTAVARVEAAKATATRAAVARAVVVVVAAEMAAVGRACLRAFWLARRARPTRELYLVADDSPESSRDWPSMRISSSETSPILCVPAHGCGRRARTRRQSWPAIQRSSQIQFSTTFSRCCTDRAPTLRCAKMRGVRSYRLLATSNPTRRS